MKSVVGKDLTKVTMPVNFNEPLSFLQVIIKFHFEIYMYTIIILNITVIAMSHPKYRKISIKPLGWLIYLRYF